MCCCVLAWRRVPKFIALANDGVVLRLGKLKAPLFAPPDFLEPTGALFKPTGSDEAEAVARNRPVGVSVFDDARTNPGEARTVRQHFSSEPLGPMAAYAISVSSVLNEIAKYPGAAGAVLSDPICDGERPLAVPGACGHAVIEGLHEADPKKKKRPEYKALLDRVAQAATRVDVWPA